ncbi:MAG TPA: hypothetical protein PLP19_10000 [bacterium]|nr:hypothetical protein [bacterium]HPN43810.1 hypothetical protein [bacterium]
MNLKNSLKGVAILFAFLTLIFTACQQSLEPKQTTKLELSNGYYQMVDETAERVTFSISFDYMVIGTECVVGGYGITWCDNVQGQANWYIAQKLQPCKIYTVETRHFCPPGVAVNPVISMQGYVEGECEGDVNLRDFLVLQKK